METNRSQPRSSSGRPDLRRWDRWLRESLAPAMVALTDIDTPGVGEYRWTVALPYGVHSMIRIPRTLIEASPEDFHRTTVGLGSFPWQPALEQAGAGGLRLVCPEEARGGSATAV